jgi:hypothetical protein
MDRETGKQIQTTTGALVSPAGHNRQLTGAMIPAMV